MPVIGCPQKEDHYDKDEEEASVPTKRPVGGKVCEEMMKMDAEGQFVPKNSRDIRQALADLQVCS